MATGRKSHFRSEDLHKPVFQLLDWHPHRSTSVVRDDKPIAFDAGAYLGCFDDFHVAIVSGLVGVVQLVLSIACHVRLKQSIRRTGDDPAKFSHRNTKRQTKCKTS